MKNELGFKDWLVLDHVKNDLQHMSSQMEAEAILEHFLVLFLESTEESKCEKCGFEGQFREKDDEYFCPVCGEKENIELLDPFSDDEDAKPAYQDEEEIEKSIRLGRDAAEEKEAKQARIAARRENRTRKGKNRKSQNLTPTQKEFAKRLRNNALWVRWAAMLQRKNDIERLSQMLANLEIESPSEMLRIKSVNKIQESFGFLDDDDDDDSTPPVAKPTPVAPSEKVKFNQEEAISILARLGYIKPSNLERLNEKQKRKTIIKKMLRAVKEKGNDPPPDIDQSELLEPVVDSMGKQQKDQWGRPKTQPSSKVKEAKQTLMTDLIGGNFADAFDYVQRGNVGYSGGRQGTKDLLDTEAPNEFVIQIIKMLTKRKPTADGWKPMHPDHKKLGTKGKEDLEGDDYVDRIIDHWRSKIHTVSSIAKGKKYSTLSPSSATKDEITNRNEVKARLNKDLSLAKRALYAKSLLDGGKTIEEVANQLKIDVNNKEEMENLQRMIDDPYESIRFHIDYLNKIAIEEMIENGKTIDEIASDLKTNKEEIERILRDADDSSRPKSEELKHRLELMKQIKMKATPGSELSLDPREIVKTLDLFAARHMDKTRSAPVYLGASKKSDEDPTLADLSTPRFARSDDEAADSSSFSASTSITPTSIAVEKERKTKILAYIYDAIRALHNKPSKKSLTRIAGPGSVESKYWQALAICIKLGLPYDAKLGRAKILQFNQISDELVQSFFNKPTKSTGEKCFQYLSRISDSEMTIRQMHERLKSITINMYGPGKPDDGGGDISEQTSRQWLSDGLKFVCDYLKTTPILI